MLTFPKGFLWGAAASAPQTEGHALGGGKTATTWDKWFELNPEKFNNNQGPEVTSNVYEFYKEDIQRMKEIGMNSYRTSISWARLLPDGKTLNKEAVTFYRSYFQTLRENGIEPIINLFHFDMPWWLMEKGGWETRESVEAFAFYAETAFVEFGDLVKRWATFNEPLVHIECGYLYGFHYPAIVDFKKAIQVGYHTLMAHVKAVEAFRQGHFEGEIGIILNVTPTYAKSNEDRDMEAKNKADLLIIKSFLDPCVLGEVSKDLVELLKDNELIPTTIETDKEIIKHNRVDYIGINYYQPMRVKAPETSQVPAQTPADFFASYDWPEKRINPYRGWEIYPEALYDVAMMMKNDYNNIPWFVSENGMGVADEERFLDEKGMVQDDYRVDFMKEHLGQLYKGIQEGSSCFGYHTWTFVDCWSWLNGYRNRYGFYRVDLDNNLNRSLKKSGLWYKELSQHNGF
ncbi:glycoside hydrolase family 1 protein [Vagococcus sp. DIV0080]|uniref:Glycoside hydrolase family 1 protein n=1 Tax=Candidatus Vagococcus giribetii TaxID=2230876 RepID=A0ABS3HSL2_9ENTE|nr:glycoside hydrolase family 1 protein [Vagococcus sp. DIV0080]MBO0476704.1 glycoside hydrolase family 1 protein [Vagococcus sp. DIV0080]